MLDVIMALQQAYNACLQHQIHSAGRICKRTEVRQYLIATITHSHLFPHFQQLDTMLSQTLTEEHIASIAWNEQGLTPVVVQDAKNKTVLMLAWVNQHSLALTLSENRPVYWSRSRGRLWRKGESSGNTQQLVSAWLDCDRDTLLFKVYQKGCACHTGAANCFFTRIDGEDS